MPLTAITDNIWIAPCNDTPTMVQPNVGIIRCGDQCVLVDAGNTPQQGREIAYDIANMGLGILHSLIYTHHHWDHIYGAMCHNPQHIIAHETCTTILKQQSEAELRRIAMMQTQTVGFRVTMPTMTFSKVLTLHIKDIEIQLEHVGGRHAADSIVVKIPSEKVMFVGDAYYPPPMSLRPPEGDDDLHIPMLEGFVAAKYDTYIDGHGQPRSHDDMAAMLAEEKARQGEK